MFTAPTALRAIKREDPQGQLARKYDTSCLRYLFLAGERCDVATWEWARDRLNIPVIDHWWQTESGWPMIANMAGLGAVADQTRFGDQTRLRVSTSTSWAPMEENCRSTGKGPSSFACRCRPVAYRTCGTTRNDSATRTWINIPGYYVSGDSGYQDEDGYFYITGRIDDVINVAGHRLSTATLEEVVAAHPAVAECAVIGIADPLKGQVPMGFVVIKSGAGIAPDQLRDELFHLVRTRVGAIASLSSIVITDHLPKTRSGKILRRTMRAIADGETYTVPSTIENPAVLERLAAGIDQQLATKQRE